MLLSQFWFYLNRVLPFPRLYTGEHNTLFFFYYLKHSAVFQCRRSAPVPFYDLLHSVPLNRHVIEKDCDCSRN